MKEPDGCPGPITIGAYRIVPDQHRIVGPERTIDLEPKVMQVLLCLVEGNGGTVSRRDLIGRVWGERGATDDLVSRAISELRRAFDDDPRRPRVIETIRKRGYRLVVPQAPAPTAAAPGGGRTVPGWTRLSLLAVLAAAVVLVVSDARLMRGNPPGWAPALSAHPLLSLAGPEIQPAFSPDGRMIAFAHRAPGHRWRSIAIVSADGGGPIQRVTREGADLSAPAWSPDGTMLAAIATSPSGCFLVTSPASAGTSHSIGACPAAQAMFLAWLGADSLVVSARAARTDSRRLYAVSAHDAGARALTNPPGRSLGDDAPTPSPAGDMIAFVRRRTEGVSDVWILTRATGAVRRVTRDDGTVYGVSWAPDGRSLLFASNREGRDAIWRLPLRGDSATWLMGTEEPAWDLVVAPDGRRFAFERRSLIADIWRVSLRDPGRPPVRSIGSTAWDAKPRVDPSNTWLLFESNRSGTYELWAANVNGEGASRLTALGAPYDGSGVWSHDSRRIAFNGRTGGTGDIWVLDRGTGAVRRITGPEADDAVPSWSRDDRWIYFASDRSGRWEVWKSPADSGALKQVTHGGGYRALEAADGRTIYFSRIDSAGIWRRSPGRPPIRVVDDLAPGDFDNWTLQDDTLFYLARGGRPGHVTLRMVPLPDGTPVALTTLDSVPREPGGIDVSPDGASLYVTRISRNESDLLVVDGFHVGGRLLADQGVRP